jgi:hypothetical protein
VKAVNILPPQSVEQDRLLAHGDAGVAHQALEHPCPVEDSLVGRFARSSAILLVTFPFFSNSQARFSTLFGFEIAATN